MDTKTLHASLQFPQLPGLKIVGATGRDGRQYWLAANFSEEDQRFDPRILQQGTLQDLSSGKPAEKQLLAPGQALLLA